MVEITKNQGKQRGEREEERGKRKEERRKKEEKRGKRKAVAKNKE